MLVFGQRLVGGLTVLGAAFLQRLSEIAIGRGNGVSNTLVSRQFGAFRTSNTPKRHRCRQRRRVYTAAKPTYKGL